MRNARLAACVATFSLAISVQAQWTDKVTTTPSLIQIDFGPLGQYLPNDGEEYCVPTSATMEMLWLVENGYTQLLPDASITDNATAQLNFVEVMGGMMGTTGTSGTNSLGAAAGIQNFLNAKGLHGQYVFEQQTSPDLNWLHTAVEDQSVGYFAVRWYDLQANGTYKEGGGHGLALLAVDVANSTITLNNPYPSALGHPPNEPSSNPVEVGFVSTSGVTLDPPLPGNPGMLETPKQGLGKPQLAVVQMGTRWKLNADAMPGNPGYTPSDWTLSEDVTLNPGNGSLDVLVPMIATNARTLTKSGAGTVTLMQNSPNLHAAVNIEGGVLKTTAGSGSPLGDGSIGIELSFLSLSPDDSSPAAISYNLADGVGSQIVVGAGAVIELDAGANPSLAVNFGGNTDGATPNLISDSGTLMLSATSRATLGVTEQFIANGSGGNLPGASNGATSPFIIGYDRAASEGFFLNYDAVNGFEAAALVQSSVTPINSVSPTAIYQVNDAQIINPGATVRVAALELGNHSLSAAGGGSLEIGGQGSSDVAGLILNGGALDAPVAFGDASTSLFLGKQSAINQPLSGSGPMSVFGPGTVTINTGQNLTGGVYIASGNVVVNNNGVGSGLGAGEVAVIGGSLTLMDDAVINNDVEVFAGATLNMDGGTLGGSLQAAGNVSGHGHIEGPAVFEGAIIQPGPIGIWTFEQGVTIKANEAGAKTVGYFTLTELQDGNSAPGGGGVYWPGFISHGNTILDDFTYLMSFDDVDDPNSSNPFWDEAHVWLIAELNPDAENEIALTLSNRIFDQGSFSYNSDSTQIQLYYTPVPEPHQWALMLGAASLAFAWGRRRRQRSADAARR